jgi:hypothetical protein
MIMIMMIKKATAVLSTSNTKTAFTNIFKITKKYIYELYISDSHRLPQIMKSIK